MFIEFPRSVLLYTNMPNDELITKAKSYTVVLMSTNAHSDLRSTGDQIMRKNTNHLRANISITIFNQVGYSYSIAFHCPYNQALLTYGTLNQYYSKLLYKVHRMLIIDHFIVPSILIQSFISIFVSIQRNDFKREEHQH